jgi:hypothetical protein
MNYYYLDGIEKRGPYSLEEIHSRNLSSDTLVFRDGSKKWVRLSDIEDIKSKKILVSYTGKKVRKINLNWVRNNKKRIFASITFLIVISLGYLIYDFFSLSESKAREISNRFFSMLVINSLDENIFNEVYPNYYTIGNRLVFKKECKINNISKNSNGDYEVFATYRPHKLQNFPIYLLIGKENFKTVIKSSKGINYAYYDRILEYGKKKGCFTGQEDDLELGRIIKEKDLRNDLEAKTILKMNTLYNSLKINKDIREEWGSVSGNVTVTNNNDIDFGYFDFECNVEFYDRNGQITSSERVYGINEIRAHASSSGNVYCMSKNAVRYKVVPVIKQSFDLKNKIKDVIIAEASYDCN